MKPLALFSIMLSLFLCGAVFAYPQRIRIPHGHGTVFVHGHMTGANARRTYTLYGRRGQDLAITLVRGGASVVMVTFANGHQDGAPGGIEDTLPMSGVNRIAVTEHHMAEPWRGLFTLKVVLR